VDVPLDCVCVCVLVDDVAVLACEAGGALDTVTVFVPEPHAASSATAPTAITPASGSSRLRLIV
jgi:hypothetical protein